MISNPLASINSFNSFDKLEECYFINKFEESSRNTLEESPASKTLNRKNNLSSNEITEISEISDVEVRILLWLEKNGVIHVVPEEKEFQYYEKKRIETQSTALAIHIESPLLQRRASKRNTSPIKEIGSPSKMSSMSKLSRFQTSKCFEIHCESSMN